MNNSSYTLINKSYTPKDILDSQLRFSIPLYQRLFAWGSKEVYTLLVDLQDHLNKIERAVSDEPYYIGILTVINGGESYELIDGQQRMTVLTLLGIELSKVQYDSNPWVAFINSSNRLHFKARSEDNLYLQSRIVPDCQAKGYINKNMEEGLNTIHSFLENMNVEDRIKFSNFVFSHVAVFFAELPSVYKREPSALNCYFEIMNSTGKGLEQHEILKVELIKNSSDSEYLTRIWNLISDMDKPVIIQKEEDSIDEYRDNYISAIAHCLNNNYKTALDFVRKSNSTKKSDLTIAEIEPKKFDFKNTQFEGSEKGVLSFPEFLLLMLQMENNIKKSDSFFRTSKLLDRFKENPIIDIKRFYHKMLLYRLLIDFYVIKRDTMTGNTSYVLYYSDSNKRSLSCLKQFQSFLYVSTDYYKWLDSYLLYIEGSLREHIKMDSLLMLKKLKQIDHSNHLSFPSDFDLDYRASYQGKRYWFWLLDYLLWEKREELTDISGSLYFGEQEQKVVETYRFRSNRSIEHLHPRDESNNDKWEEDSINAFGNLAMISQSFNSMQTNDPVHVKFARIEDQANNSALQSIKLYLMYLIAKGNHWEEKMVIPHQEEMMRVLKNYFMEIEVV